MPEEGDFSSLAPLREVIARHGLGARKSLGQHFLLDLNLTGRIARAAGPLLEGTTIEVGPGPGGLTRALLAAGSRHLIAIEKDRRCLAALAELAAASGGRLEIIEADALAVAVEGLGETPRRIVANLPYNVATPLLLGWLKAIAVSPSSLESLTLMFQKEVAERLAARPGSKSYGRLSVLTQWLSEARLLFDVPASAFTPPPKVTSSVVKLLPRAEPLAPAPLALLERITAAAFGQRRKMLRQALRSFTADPLPLLERAAIDPTRRGEELSVAEFCALARAAAAQPPR